METKILLAVSKPVMYVGTPLRIAVLNLIFAVILYGILDMILVSLGFVAVFQATMAWLAYNNPHFDKILLARYLRPKTKSLIRRKGNRYVGR